MRLRVLARQVIGGNRYMPPAMSPDAALRLLMLRIFSASWSPSSWSRSPLSFLKRSFCPPMTTSALHWTCPKGGAAFPTARVVLFFMDLRKSSAVTPSNSVQQVPEVYTEWASLPARSAHLPG